MTTTIKAGGSATFHRASHAQPGDVAVIPTRGNSWAPLAPGLRPFFLLASPASIASMLLWRLSWRGHFVVPAHDDPVSWHAHETL